MNFKWTKSLIVPVAAGFLAIGGLTGCEIDQTRAGELPEVDVDIAADPGRLPKFDIDGPDVNIGTTVKTVKVPKVRVEMVEEEIEVPYIDVDAPGDDELERTLPVEIEVQGEGYDLDIEEVHVVDGQLWVISTLEEPDTFPRQRPTMRISDRVVIKAPEMPVKHVVIGKRPAGDHNTQYMFVDSREDLEDKLESGKVLFD